MTPASADRPPAIFVLMTFTDEDRARLLAEFDGSRMTARDFARAHGLSERTLRSWRARARPPRSVTPADMRRVVVAAIDQLTRLLGVLDAAEGLPAPALPAASADGKEVVLADTGARAAGSSGGGPDDHAIEGCTRAGDAGGSAEGTTDATVQEAGTPPPTEVPPTHEKRGGWDSIPEYFES